MWRPDKPFNDLPSLPPKQDFESKDILKQCVKSHSSLAKLDQACKLIPNQTILINTLLLLEAKDSSEIENIVTTTDDLFRYVQAENQADPATKEAIRYRTALLTGLNEISKRPLNINTANIICSQLKDVEMDIRRVPGTALANQRTREIIYTPPEGEQLLRQLFSNWEIYLHNEHGIDPLVQMAVLHYQFEAIHPYTDGNGRTGRVLNVLFLIEKQLLSSPVLYLSRYIISNKDKYYDLLLEVTRKQEWSQWVLFMLKAVEETAEWTREKILAITELMESATKFVQAQLPKIYSHELIQVIFQQPYCRISDLVDAGIAKRQTASEYLKKLVDIRVLQEQQVGREKIFINPKLMRLLDQPNNSFLPYMSIETLANHFSWMTQWRAPGEMNEYVDELMNSVGSKTLFNKAGTTFILEAWIAGHFAEVVGAKTVRLIDDQWPDLEVELDDQLIRFEAIEADMPDRRRGDEYKLAPRMYEDPVENWVARAEAVPGALQTAVRKKRAKHYSKHENLLIYLNIGEFGIRHREIIAAFPDATKDARDIFKSVWILWKEQAFEVWRDGEASQRVYGEPGGFVD